MPDGQMAEARDKFGHVERYFHSMVYIHVLFAARLASPASLGGRVAKVGLKNNNNAVVTVEWFRCVIWLLEPPVLDTFLAQRWNPGWLGSAELSRGFSTCLGLVTLA